MIIRFCGQNIILDPTGIAILDSSRTAIVSDLHLEKGSHFAERGYFLPPYDSEQTLDVLIDILRYEDIKRLILLGDCFHDERGYMRLSRDCRQKFETLLTFDPIWIKGNHDKSFVPDHFPAFEVYIQEGLIFRHEASLDATAEISGHFHPKANIIHKNAKIDRACFVEDGRKLIMPAFGAYTGGLAVGDPAIRRLFKDDIRMHVLGMNKIFSFPFTA